MQNRHPIAYSSQGLKKGKTLMLSTYEKETLSILLAVDKRRQYLLGHRFVIKTDQRSLKLLLDKKLRQESQHPCRLKLAKFDYLVEYKRGLENLADDALSCRDEVVGEGESYKAVSMWSSLGCNPSKNGSVD